MNYELAKQLKDAGFPQDKYKDGISFSHSNLITTPQGFLAREKLCYAPTLEELIDACGRKFNKLQHSRVHNTWEAVYKHKTIAKTLIIRTGKTPVEAVANLWLELNEGKGTK